MNWSYDWNHLSYSSIFLQLVKIAASGWVYGLTFCCDEEPGALLWTEARLVPWLAGVLQEFSLWSSFIHLLLEKWQLPVLGGPVHMMTLDMQSFTWVLGSFSILPSPWISPTCLFPKRGAFDLLLRIIFLSFLVRLWENVGYNYILKY